MKLACPHCSHPLTDTQVKSLWAQRNSAIGAKHGGRKPIPTPCRRCKVLCPSAREAWMHCGRTR